VLTAPDYAEPLCGWRAWCLVEAEDRVLLRSVVRETFWPVRRPLLARCIRAGRDSDHLAPKATCRCGIYAAYDPATALHVLEGYGQYSRGQRRVGSVLGRVLLWGEIVECENGWRAASAYPAHLYLLDGADTDTVRYADALAVYGVPVESVTWRSPSETLAVIGGEPD
jgi:hypothetical protein